MVLDSAISVIIPTYNNSDDEIQRIGLIIAASTEVDEFLIIDDGSQNGTGEKVKALPQVQGNPKVVLLINETNRGPAYTRNRGLDVAKGEYVAFLDSDDYWHPQKLALQVSLMRRLGAKICGSRHQVILSEKSLVGACAHRYAEDGIPFSRIRWSQSLFRSPFSTPSVVLHRDVFSCLRFDEEYRYAEDYEFWLRVLRLYPCIRLELPLTYTFKHDYLADGESLSADLKSMQRWQRLCFIGLIQSSELSIGARVLAVIGLLFSQLKYLRRILMRFMVRRVNVLP